MNPERVDTREMAERFLSVAKSILEFTDHQIHGIIKSVVALSPSPRENCFLVLYYRAYADMKTLTRIQGAQDIQTVARIARAMLEYAVDLRLVEVIPDPIQKMVAFVDTEKLKAAERAVAFKQAHPNSEVDTAVFEEFVRSNQADIKARQRELWPNAQRVDHWSLLSTADRCKKLGPPFEQWYEVDFRKLSWHVHSGLTGFFRVPPDSFNTFGAVALELLGQTFCEVLRCVIKEFKIDKATSQIDRLMKFARMAPFSSSDEQAQELFRELMS